MKNAMILAVLAAAAFGTAYANEKDGQTKTPRTFTSRANPDWSYWKIRGYSFGVDTVKIPVPAVFGSQIMTNSTVMVRGENSLGKRWGYHCFEAYADDDMSRITMLVNKHVEEGKAVAETYYYGTKYNHSNAAYNWFKVGSDVRGHSFMFDRDRAVFFGSLDMRSAMALPAIGAKDIRPDEPRGDADANFVESAKHVKYKSLKNARDGTLYFDKDKNMVVVKIGGKWCKVCVEPLEGYDICAVAEDGKSAPLPEIKAPTRLLVGFDTVGEKSQMMRCGISLRNLADLTEEEDYCTRFRSAKNLYDGDRFIMYGEFADDDAIAKHRASTRVLAEGRVRAQRYPSLKEESKVLQILPKATDSSGLVIFVEIEVPENLVDEFIKISKPLRDGGQAEEGTYTYQLWRDIYYRNKFYIFEHYKSREAHRIHSRTKHYNDWNDKCKELGIGRTAKFYDVQ